MNNIDQEENDELPQLEKQEHESEKTVMSPFESEMQMSSLEDVVSSTSFSTSSEPATSSGCVPINSEDRCAVCGDRMNSRRYGVPACLGCIVFFRRAIVNNLRYKCLRNQNCVITNEYRCSCRYCRLQKCLKVGMRPEAIQRRDVVGPRKPINVKEVQQSIENSTSQDVIFVYDSDLLKGLAEFQRHQISQHHMYFKEHEMENSNFQPTSEIRRRARSHDVNIMLKLCLNQASEWGKQFKPFRRLNAESKQNILSEYGFGFLLIDQGFKTAYEAQEGFWLLQNGTFMHPNYFLGLSEEDGKKDKSNVKAQFHFKFVTDLLNCVSTPFRQLQIDEIECAALKTVLLLTPSFPKRAIYAGQEGTVASLHTKCMDELMDYSEKRFPGKGAERFGEILLLISSIRCGVKALYNQTRVSDVFNLMEFDPFVRGVLLN